MIAWLESMTRLDSSHDFWWLEPDSSHGFHKMTRVTVDDSRLGSESLLQNLWAPDGQTQFVCTQRNTHFLLQGWSKLTEIFCFACLVVLCCILRITFPQLAQRKRLETLLSLRGQQVTIYWHLILVKCSICISWSWQWAYTVTLSLFQIPVKWFKFFRFKSKPKITLQKIMQIRKPNLV